MMQHQRLSRSGFVDTLKIIIFNKASHSVYLIFGQKLFRLNTLRFRYCVIYSYSKTALRLVSSLWN